MTQDYENLLKKLRPLREELESIEKEKLEWADQKQIMGDIMDSFKAIESVPEETDTSVIDDNLTKRVHRRRVNNSEQGI